MRILLAHNNFSIKGGAEVFYHDVGRVLEANGNQVAYFSCAEDVAVSSPWQAYFPPAASYDTGSLVSRIARFPQMIYSRRAKQCFEALLQDFKPDIVHAFAIYTKLTPSILDAATANNVPVVMTCNDYKLICPNYTLYHHGHICEDCKGGRFFKAFTNRCGHDSVVFSAGMAAESYAHEFTNIYRKNIDTFLFESEFIAKKTEEFWGPGTFRWKLMLKPFNSSAHPFATEQGDYCLYVGRLHNSKGVHILLEALCRHRDVKLLIVGDGPERARLEAMRQNLNLAQVQFLGWQDHEHVSRYIRKSRFVIVPSVWYENFPYVITEAFAHGKAVIGSAIGGIPELVRHGSFGFVYNSVDAVELGKCIAQLWSDPELSVRMGRSAKEWCDDRFSDSACYVGLKDVYDAAIARKKPA